MLLANQILHILYIFIKPNVWYSWTLKLLAIKRRFPFNFAKPLQGRHFVEGGPKSFQLLVATSSARNFNNNWPIYLNFSNMIKLCPNIWFIKNSKFQQFVFWKRSRQKFFIFLKGRYFVMGGPINMNFGVFWETPVDFLKSVVLQRFPKYIQSNVNLNVKNRAKFNCL